jgi:hypothetical protein
MTEVTAEGFIPHDGGPCPVPPETMVEIIIRCTDGRTKRRKDDDQAGWFTTMNWWDGSGRWKIIAYRPTQQETR